MSSRVSFGVAGIVLATLTCAHAGELVVSGDEVLPEVAAMQAEAVGPVKPVVVVNPPAQPVPVDGQVRVVNTPDVNVVNPIQVVQIAKTPVNVLRDLIIEDGEQGSNFADMFKVPEGKQLVVTHASAAISESSQVAFRVDLLANNTFLAINDIPGLRSGPLVVGGSDSWAMSLPIEMYVRAGVTVTCAAFRGGSSGRVFGRCGVSGYLVDVAE